MKWLTGYTEVSFPGLNLDLNVYENHHGMHGVNINQATGNRPKH